MSSAAFVGIDATTQGSWSGVYGSRGYYKLETSSKTLVSSLPSGVTVSTLGSPTIFAFVTPAPASDPRALQRVATPAGTRDADTWYSASSFAYRVTPSDSVSRRVSLYVIDWDSTARSIGLSVQDHATSTVLDSRTAAAGGTGSGSLNYGLWYTWDLVGDVDIYLTKVAGPNATGFGLFFDDTPAGGSIVPLVVHHRKMMMGGL